MSGVRLEETASPAQPTRTPILAVGTTYFYTIRAANADGETSAWSDYVSTATAIPAHTPTVDTHTYSQAYGHGGDSHTYTNSHDRSTQRLQSE